MDEDIKNSVQRQFGQAAGHYVTSQVHAQGASLARLVALVNPQPGWRVLDVATGGGHTALAFAAQGCHVTAGDLTLPMLAAARQHATDLQARHLAFCAFDAEHLPFAAETFDAVTCRIAAHHFPDVPRFVRESARVLRPGGLLAVADNLSSGEPRTARFYNDFEKLRDPSHHWAYSMDDWDTFFFAAGLEVLHREQMPKELDFDQWAARMGVAGDDLLRLRVVLLHAPQHERDWLQPLQTGQQITLTLTEGLITGRKAGL
jgi:ubiquinone/menaquinone biosynthesis C-methylase UbiE